MGGILDDEFKVNPFPIGWPLQLVDKQFCESHRKVVARRVDTVSSWIVEIRERAGVKVDDKDGTEKFASSHDQRRVFGTRWAKIVPPGILKELMRHASIQTTMNFYVSITAKDTMSEVRRHVQKHGNSNSPKKVNEKVNE